MAAQITRERGASIRDRGTDEIGGLGAGYVLYGKELEGTSETAMIIKYSISVNSRPHIISCGAPAEKFDHYDPTFQDVIDSYRPNVQ